jgi:SAM-dependent methyltransferase
MDLTVFSCPVCGGGKTHTFLKREGVPVHQNLVYASREKAVNSTSGTLAMAVCADCGFVFNAEFDGSKLNYGADYDNTQSCSPYFGQYMNGLAQHLMVEEGVRHCKIIEVGCGKGAFLKLLVEDPSSGNSGVGFDPSYVGPESVLDGRLQFKRRFYDGDCVDMPGDVVICRHVIEHVPQPLELLRAVRLALRHAKSPKIYFETPCVEWILRHQVIWDFFYEHCALFTASSLRTAFERVGFSVLGVRHVFGGQYLWLEAGLSNEVEVSMNPGNIPAMATRYGDVEKSLCGAWRARVENLRKKGPVAVWGAGAKGTTFVHQVDPSGQLIDCLIDLNPNKQGKFVSRTGHPIVGIQELFDRGVQSAILMNPNYREENEKLLGAAGISIELTE